MTAFHIHLDDDGRELITGADTYQQEGPLTTFFSTAPGRQTVDSWSTRLASFRTSRIVAIRRVEEPAASFGEVSRRRAAEGQLTTLGTSAAPGAG